MYTIVSVYLSPMFSLQNVNVQFFTTLDLLWNYCVLLGDFNVNLCSNDDFTFVNDFTYSFIADGFEPLIKIPTRTTVNSAICFDHIFTNFRVECSSGVIEVKVSDHNAILASLCITKTKLNDHKKSQFRDHSGQSLEKSFGLVYQNILKSFRFLKSLMLMISLKYFQIPRKVVIAKAVSFEVKMLVISNQTPGSSEDYLFP